MRTICEAHDNLPWAQRYGPLHDGRTGTLLHLGPGGTELTEWLRT